MKISIEFHEVERLIRENERLQMQVQHIGAKLSKVERELNEALIRKSRLETIVKAKEGAKPKSLKELLLQALREERWSNQYSAMCEQFRMAVQDECGAPNRIEQIKRIRELTDFGLKDAKNFFEGLNNLHLVSHEHMLKLIKEVEGPLDFNGTEFAVTTAAEEDNIPF